MWSYPNLIPLDPATIEDIARRVERFRFDRIYGGWWGRVVVHDGAATVRRSADRYLARLRGERPASDACLPMNRSGRRPALPKRRHRCPQADPIPARPARALTTETPV